MDPNETLEFMREWAEFILDPDSNVDDVRGAGPDLAEAVQNLDNWLKNGGAFPDTWMKCPDGDKRK